MNTAEEIVKLRSDVDALGNLRLGHLSNIHDALEDYKAMSANLAFLERRQEWERKVRRHVDVMLVEMDSVNPDVEWAAEDIMEELGWVIWRPFGVSSAYMLKFIEGLL